MNKEREKILNKKFELEFAKYSDYIQIDKSTARDIFKKIANEISGIPFYSTDVELTPLNCVKFTFKLDDERMLMVTYPFYKVEGIEPDSVIFSFMVKNEIIIHDATTVTNLVEGFNKYMSDIKQNKS